ncbi:hypothetical protein F5879DRAFT_994108 [Lentinula edodes]|nr:hypothetical protein F5879DRAFT_994108 [Lentinula edodes]
MRWLAPPTRRELTLLLFCSTVFTLAYNFENTLRYVGFDAYSTRGALLTRFGFTPANTVAGTLLGDGRKVGDLRDQMDNIIIWNGEDNKIIKIYSESKGAYVEYGTIEAGQPLGVGAHSAMWISQARLEELWPNRLAAKSVKEGFWRWNEDVPRTKLIRHLPGYTVLDQPVVLNNVIYIVTDEPHSFPELSSITRSMLDNMRVISTQQARIVLGKYGGRIHGVSWMCTETIPQDTALLSLWSMHSTLSNSSIDSSPAKISSSFPPDSFSPARLILPLTPTFTDPDNDENGNKKPNFPFNYAEGDILPPGSPPRPPVIPRSRSHTGIHPLLLKIALPHMPGVWYKEDWDDYMGMEVPYVLERVVIGDYGVQGIETLLQQHSQSGSRDWWEPIRKTVVSFFQDPSEISLDLIDNSRKKTLTYIRRPNSLVAEDHNALVRALMKMGREKGIEVNLVDAGASDGMNVEKVNTDDVKWGTRMGAITRSDILLASQGSDILDGVFLRPSSPASTSIMVEFFAPSNSRSNEGEAAEVAFPGAREHEAVAKSLGLRYIPWSIDFSPRSSGLVLFTLHIEFLRLSFHGNLFLRPSSLQSSLIHAFLSDFSSFDRRLTSDEIANSQTLAPDSISQLGHNVPVDANTIAQFLNDILESFSDI